MCNPYTEYTNFTNIINDLKENDYILIKDKDISGFEAVVTSIVGNDVYVVLYDYKAVNILFLYILTMVNDENHKDHLTKILNDYEFYNYVKKNIKIKINTLKQLHFTYESQEYKIRIAFTSDTIEYIKCLKPSSIYIKDLFDLLPRKFTIQEEIEQKVLDWLVDTDNQRIVTEFMMNKFVPKQKFSILPDVDIAPDFHEHSFKSEEHFNKIIKNYIPLRDQPDINLNTISKKYYYKMVPYRDNLLSIASNFESFNFIENKKNKYIKLIDDRYNYKLNKIHTTLTDYDKRNIKQAAIKYISKQYPTFISDINNFVDNVKNKLVNYDKKDKINLSLKVENLQDDMIYIQPVSIATRYRFESEYDLHNNYKGHIATVFINPSKNIAYYMDSEAPKTTTFVITSPFTNELVLLDLNAYLRNLKHALKLKGVSKLMNLKDVIKNCPYATHQNHIGAQEITMDNRCQTWVIYYTIMFALNIIVPKGYLVNLIAKNSCKRMIQFTNYLYENFLKPKEEIHLNNNCLIV